MIPIAWRAMTLRVALAGGLVATALVGPGLAHAAASGGTLIGTVTCGPDEETPAAHVLVDLVGTGLSARTDGAGRFVLQSAPSGRSLVLDASLEPTGSSVTSRYNVVVQAGETLDVGNLDLPACPMPIPPSDDSSPSPLSDGGN